MQQLHWQPQPHTSRVGAAATRSIARIHLNVAARYSTDGSRFARLGNAPKEALAGVLRQMHSTVASAPLDPRRWLADRVEQAHPASLLPQQQQQQQHQQQQQQQQQQASQVLVETVQDSSWASSNGTYMEAGPSRRRLRMRSQRQHTLLRQLQLSPYMASIPDADDILLEYPSMDAVTVGDDWDVAPSRPWQDLLHSQQQEWQQQLTTAAPVAAVLLAAAALSVPGHRAASISSRTERDILPGPAATSGLTANTQSPAAFSSRIATLESGVAPWPAQLAAATWLLLYCAQQQQQAGLDAAASSSSSMCILLDDTALTALDHIYASGCALAALGNSPDLLGVSTPGSSSSSGSTRVHMGSVEDSSRVSSTTGAAPAMLLRVLDYCHILDTYVQQHEEVLRPGFLQQLEDLSLQAKGHLARGQVTTRQQVFSVLGQQLLGSIAAGQPAATPSAATAATATAAAAAPGSMPPIAIHINTTSISNPDVSVNPVVTNSTSAQASTAAHLENNNVSSSNSSAELVAPAPNPLSAAVSLLGMVACGAWGGVKVLAAAVRLVRSFLTQVLLLRGLLSVGRAAKAVGSAPSMQSRNA